MRGLALSLRGTAADDVTFMTLPVAGTSTDPTYGSIVNVDEAKSEELFDALKNDTMADYLDKWALHVSAVSPSERRVGHYMWWMGPLSTQSLTTTALRWRPHLDKYPDAALKPPEDVQ